VGSERVPRRTRLKPWSGLGRSGKGSPAGGRRAAVRWCWEQRSGEREEQGDGELASAGPRAAIYREEEVREGHKAEDHGCVEVAVLAALRRPVARAWQCRKGPRMRAKAAGRARGSARSEGARGPALQRPKFEETVRRRREQRSRGKVEDDWTDLQNSEVPGTCL
jgi:hypothetical protein